MTNPIALFLGIAIVLAIGVDIVFFDSRNLLFLAKEFMALIEWIKFWR